MSSVGFQLAQTPSRLFNLALPARASEIIYTNKRDLVVDYQSLNCEVHIPTYNEEDYIERTLKSLSRQDPVKSGDVNLVLIDSFSDDDTVQIARDYVDDIIMVTMGKLTARNKGVDRRRADVVLSADAGDIYSKGWVDELCKPFEEPDVVASFGNIYSKEAKFKRGQKVKHSIVNTWNLPGNNSAIRVSTLQDIGKFDTDIDQQDLVDMVLEEQITTKAELLAKGKIAYRPYAAAYKCQRRKMLSSDTVDKYDKERERGERF